MKCHDVSLTILLTVCCLRRFLSGGGRGELKCVVGVAVRSLLCSATVRKEPDPVRRNRFARINSRATAQAMIECFVTGLLAWRDGQPGQVGNEAATAVFHQCRGSGSSPSFFLSASAGFSATSPNSCFTLSVAVSGACRDVAVVFRAPDLFFSIGPLAGFNEAATRVHVPSRFGFERHCY